MPLIASSEYRPPAFEPEPRSFQPSDQQARFLDYLDGGAGHVLLEARAGTGKSTTCREGAWRLHAKGLRSTYVCFNKHVADEFQRDLPVSCRAATMHALGYKLIQDTHGTLQIDEDKVDRIAERYFPGQEGRLCRRPIAKLVSLCKNLLIDGSDPDELRQLAADKDIDLPQGLESDICAVVPEILDACRDPQGTCDFDDMIWLPVEDQLEVSRSPDVLFIDEAQDLNPCQHGLVELLCPTGRTVVVGDRWQSIYAWRGADARSIERLETNLAADPDRGFMTFPLTVTRRCPRKVVELARQLVPDLDHLPDAPDGIVECVKPEQWSGTITLGDMILCRTNAPLVSACFSLISRGVRAFVRGRDIGKGLLVVLARLRRKDVPGLVRAIGDYRAQEAAKFSQLRNPENALQALNDKCDCLLAMTEGASTVDEVKQRVEVMFADLNDANAVTLSSIHKAKGLERDHVIILRPDLLPGPWASNPDAYQQEKNVAYVGVTRAKQRLTFAGEAPALFCL